MKKGTVSARYGFIVMALFCVVLFSGCAEGFFGNGAGDRVSDGSCNEVIVGDFILTISVENTTVQQGEDIRVNVELRNNSGEDHEIAYMFLFVPYIPGVLRFPAPSPRPWPGIMLLENNGVFSRYSHPRAWFGWPLPQGVHQLTVSSFFYLGWEQPPMLVYGHISWDITRTARRINVSSNTIEITVQ